MELDEIKRHLNNVQVQITNTESDTQISGVLETEIDKEVIVINGVDSFEECFICFKRLYDVRKHTLQPRDPENELQNLVQLLFLDEGGCEVDKTIKEGGMW